MRSGVEMRSHGVLAALSVNQQALIACSLKCFLCPPPPASQGLPEGEHSHPSQPGRSKTPQISQDPKGPPAAGPEQSHHPTVNRHAAQIDPHVHLQRAQADTGQTSYPSPVAISMKQELPSPHQPQAVPKQSLFIPTTSGPGAPPGLSLNRPEPQSALKQEPSPHPVSQRPVDMVQLLTVSIAPSSSPGRGALCSLLDVGREIIREVLPGSPHVWHQNLTSLASDASDVENALICLLPGLFLSPVNS